MLAGGPFCYILTWRMTKGQKETNTMSSNSRTGANLLPEILKVITLFTRAKSIKSHLSTLSHWNNLNTNVCRRQKQSNYSTKDLLVLLQFCLFANVINGIMRLASITKHVSESHPSC